jgi:WhiB family redox-sensing transcriptional regulator
MTHRFFVPSDGTVPLCSQIDPEIFFPQKGASPTPGKAFCFACEARLECLDYALANGERFGIWGGMTGRERRRLLAHGGQEAAA